MKEMVGFKRVSLDQLNFFIRFPPLCFIFEIIFDASERNRLWEESADLLVCASAEEKCVSKVAVASAY